MKTFTVSTLKVKSFRRRLLRWYATFGRHYLPWRQTRDPYAIVVSEIMLQQTQVDRVIPRYQAWLQQFPTVQKLAAARIGTVLKAWSGLGYNRRALALQQLAKSLEHNYHGHFPRTVEELQTFKGIGQYTAHALSIFAFEQNVPLVDTNIKRVLGRIFFGYQQLAQWRDTTEPFWELSRRIVDLGGKAYPLNQGLMDFGATVCTAKKPRCRNCPLRQICSSYPEIVQAEANSLRVKTKRVEPLYFGQPRRIWRGRILQFLHTQNRPVTVQTLGQALQPDWSVKRIPWLETVIAALVKDGLVVYKNPVIKIP